VWNNFKRRLAKLEMEKAAGECVTFTLWGEEYIGTVEGMLQGFVAALTAEGD